MAGSDLNRRDFNRLTLAAFSGIVAGTMAGCGGGAEEKTKTGAGKEGAKSKGAAGGTESKETKADTGTEAKAEGPDPTLLAQEPHVCRGLNTCQGKGKGGENACAGQGTCATAVAHSCSGQSECKGQGGCGEYPGQNACKGLGECAVPLSDEAWAKARAAFEEQMKAAGTEVGAAPPKS